MYINLYRSFFRFVTNHAFDRQTDGQTDRILIARPRLHSTQRVETEHDTIFHGPNLNGGSRDALSAKRLRRQTDMVDGVWTEVGQQVRVDWRRDGHVYAASLNGIVEIQLI